LGIALLFLSLSLEMVHHDWASVIHARTRTGVQAGGDRQELHEKIRVHSMAAGAVVKGQGQPNDLLSRIAHDAAFVAVHNKLPGLVDPILFVGRAPQQVLEFITDHVDPVLEAHRELWAVPNVDGVNV
jgi:adenylosuccinate lyase